MPYGTDPSAKDFSYWKQKGTTRGQSYYLGSTTSLTMATAATAIDTLVAIPFIAGIGGIADRIAFEVTAIGGAGSVARCGIYDCPSESNLYPVNLIVDGGQFDTFGGGTGMKVTTIAAPIIRNRLYFSVYLAGVSAPTVRTISSTAAYQPLGYPGAGFGGSAMQVYAPAFAYAALPSIFPAGGSLTTITLPLVGLRFSV